MCNQRFELIEPGKWPLEAELSRYESCHALSSAIASIFTTAFARSRDLKETPTYSGSIKRLSCRH